MNQTSIDHRKSSVRLKLVNSSGEPLTRSKVDVKQIEHEFLFGCGSPDGVRFLRESDETKRAMYKDQMDKWLNLFNFSTLHFYWGFYEYKEGHTNVEFMTEAAKFYQSQNVKMKGHPLCWHTCCANWLLEYSNEEILAKQRSRIQREVTGYRGLVDMWDVINEVVIMPDYDRYDNAITRICKDLGRVKLVKTLFDEAKQANPDACLLINDFNLSTNYEILIDGCLNAGVPISAIGIQTHQHQGYMGAERLYDILHRFEKFGLPLHFTENTLISGDLMPRDIVDLNDFQPKDWPSTEEGEARQSKDMEEMYRILFEHPLVEAVTAWDFVDGAWLGAPSGLLRKDNSCKPAYDMLHHLIKEEWMTNGECMTDEEGYVLMEGIRGEYELRVGNQVAQYTLNRTSQEQELVLHVN